MRERSIPLPPAADRTSQRAADGCDSSPPDAQASRATQPPESHPFFHSTRTRRDSSVADCRDCAAPHVLSHSEIGGRDDACISVSAQVLGGIKAEGSSRAQRTRAAPAPLRSDRLRRILDNRNTELLTDRVERIHVRALPVEVHRKNRAEIRWPLLDDSPAHKLRIQVQGARINVHQDRSCARPHNGARRSEEAERGSDDRIARLHARRDQSEPQRSVPEAQPTAATAPVSAEISRSSASTSGPRMYPCESHTRVMAASTSPRMVSYCRRRSSSGTAAGVAVVVRSLLRSTFRSLFRSTLRMLSRIPSR